MANLIRLWNWTHKVKFEVIEIVRVCGHVLVLVRGIVHLCAGLPQKREKKNILQALTQSPEILSFELISSTHADWQNQH